MNETVAWECFAHTGKVSDYLIYSQCRQQVAVYGQEETDADRHRRPGDPGEYRGRE